MKMILVENGRTIPKAEAQAVLLEVSRTFRVRQAERLDRVEKRYQRNGCAPERASVSRAMIAVEDRLVRAFWTIARQPAQVGPKTSFDKDGDLRLGHSGLGYFPEPGDLTGYQDAAGGRWDSVAPRPPIPGSKEIDQASAALDWLLFVDEPRRRVLVAGATSKRGDSARQINWTRLKHGMPDLKDYSSRTLHGRYREALRIIVNELTLARLAG